MALVLGGVQSLTVNTWQEAFEIPDQEAMLTGSPLWILAPGACIAALGAAVALINYGVDEIGNPALRGKKKKPKRVYITPNP